MQDEKRFELKSQFKPTGDQPQAIAGLTDGLINGHKYQTLLGAVSYTHLTLPTICSV